MRISPAALAIICGTTCRLKTKVERMLESIMSS